MGSLWTGDRFELTRLASQLITDPVGTEVALLGAGASSLGAEAGAMVSPEEEGTEAMGGAGSSPEVGAMEAPETTTAGEGLVLPGHVGGLCWDAGTGLGCVH